MVNNCVIRLRPVLLPYSARKKDLYISHPIHHTQQNIQMAVEVRLSMDASLLVGLKGECHLSKKK